MREMIVNRAKSAKIFKIVLFVLLALCIIACIAMLIPVFAVGIIVLWMLWCVYLGNFSPALGNSKWLAAKGYTNVADEFNINMPMYKKSKIICGTRSLLIKNVAVVVPYQEIAWMYVQVRRLYGLIPIGKSILIYTRDGKGYTAGGNVDELKAILTEHVLRANPNVIVGFGAEQQKRYRAVKEANKNR